jgi:hypothetical protein
VSSGQCGTSARPTPPSSARTYLSRTRSFNASSDSRVGPTTPTMDATHLALSNQQGGGQVCDHSTNLGSGSRAIHSMGASPRPLASRCQNPRATPIYRGPRVKREYTGLQRRGYNWDRRLLMEDRSNTFGCRVSRSRWFQPVRQVQKQRASLRMGVSRAWKMHMLVIRCFSF